MNELGLIDPLQARRSPVGNLLATLAAQDNAARHDARQATAQTIGAALGQMAQQRLATAELVARLREQARQRRAEQAQAMQALLARTLESGLDRAAQEREAAAERATREKLAELGRATDLEVARLRTGDKDDPLKAAIHAKLAGKDWEGIEEEIKKSPELADLLGIQGKLLPKTEQPVPTPQAAIEEAGRKYAEAYFGAANEKEASKALDAARSWYARALPNMTPAQAEEYKLFAPPAGGEPEREVTLRQRLSGIAMPAPIADMIDLVTKGELPPPLADLRARIGARTGSVGGELPPEVPWRGLLQPEYEWPPPFDEPPLQVPWTEVPEEYKALFGPGRARLPESFYQLLPGR